MKKTISILLCLFSFHLVSSSLTSPRQFITFLHDLNSQCPSSIPFSLPPIQVDGELLESSLSSSQKNDYTAILFYASWCPFSRDFQTRLSTLSSMYPQIKHLMVEQSSSVPSIFSRYGIHSVPSLLMVNQTTRMRYYGRKDLPSLVNFYKRATGLKPIVDMVEDTSSNTESEQLFFHFWKGTSLKEISLNEPYLLFSIIFVLSRVSLYYFPNIASHLVELWVAYIPRLNLEIFGESRQFIGRVLHLVDAERIWSKLKLCKTRNFHQGARNARVWASSLASVSLGQASSSRGS